MVFIFKFVFQSHFVLFNINHFHVFLSAFYYFLNFISTNNEIPAFICNFFLNPFIVYIFTENLVNFLILISIWIWFNLLYVILFLFFSLSFFYFLLYYFNITFVFRVKLFKISELLASDIIFCFFVLFFSQFLRLIECYCCFNIIMYNVIHVRYRLWINNVGFSFFFYTMIGYNMQFITQSLGQLIT